MSEYEVGYGKPPKATRFKKGICPNPNGRGRRRPLETYKIIDAILQEPVEIQGEGKKKKMSRQEFILKKFAALALKGDVAIAALLLQLKANELEGADSGPTRVTFIGGPGPGTHE
jgi:uncharacterized protein DUF5681